MPSDSRKRYLLAAIIVAMVGIVAAVLVRSRKSIDTSERRHQRTQQGEPIEDEWGEESFPASDPPQSW